MVVAGLDKSCRFGSTEECIGSGKRAGHNGLASLGDNYTTATAIQGDPGIGGGRSIGALGTQQGSSRQRWLCHCRLLLLVERELVCDASHLIFELTRFRAVKTRVIQDIIYTVITDNTPRKIHIERFNADRKF